MHVGVCAKCVVVAVAGGWMGAKKVGTVIVAEELKLQYSLRT